MGKVSEFIIYAVAKIKIIKKTKVERHHLEVKIKAIHNISQLWF